MSPQIDPAQIERFMDALFRYAEEGTWLSLRIFHEHRKDVAPLIEAVPVNGDMGKMAAAAARFAAIAARRNQPSVFAPPVATFTNAQHARYEDLACCLALSAELDNEAQEGLATLIRLLDRPTVVVESGGRWGDEKRGGPKLHAYWRYTEAAIGDDIAFSGKLRRAVATLVGGDPTNVPDSHPIRWPGSLHRKGDPKLARIVEINEDAEIDLKEALEAVELACKRAGKRPSAASASVNAEYVEPITPQPEKFMALVDNSREFKKAWNEGFKKDGVPDHSVCDWWLALEAARAGWSNEEIAGLIVSFRTKVGERNKATPGYLGLTIAKIRHSLDTGKTVLDDELFAAEQAIDKGDTDEAIRSIGARLGFDLKKVVITGMATAFTYWLELADGRRVNMGDAAAFLAQDRVRGKVMASTGVVLNKVKQQQWDDVVRMLLAVAEREDAADSDPIASLDEMINDYLDNYKPSPWDTDDCEAAFRRGLPITKDGNTFIGVKSLYNWSVSKGGEPIAIADMRARMRQLGWSGQRITRRTEDNIICRFYWARGK